MNIFKMSALVGLAACVCGPAQAETLRLGDWQSTTHIVSIEGTTKWMAKVEELTGGALSFQHFPSQQAAPAKELLEAVRGGVLDAALIGPLYSSDVLPLHSVVGLPGFYSSAEEGTVAFQKMLAEGPLREELLKQDVVPIFGFVLPPYQVLSKGGRLGGPDDWKGLSIRTSGTTQALVARSLGGAAVSLPGPEVYTAVERGRLDAVLFPLPSVPAYNLQEVVSHISTNGSFGGYSFVIVVRKEAFDGLSSDVQEALLSAGAETALHVARVQDESVGALAAEWAKAGVEVYKFEDAEIEAINAAIATTREEWIERIGSQDPRAADMVKRYQELIAQ